MAIIGPVFPPPGGVTFSRNPPTGSAGEAGGVTFNFSGFDFTQYDRLWWGPANIRAAMDGSTSAAVNSPGETLTFGSLSGDIATWTGSTTVSGRLG